MQNIVLNVHPTTKLWDVLKAKFEKSSASDGSCKNDAFHKLDHDEHQGDDAPLEGEKNAKRQKTSKSSKSGRDWDAWVDKLVIDEDEVILVDETPELIDEFQNRNTNEPPRYLYNKALFFLKNGNTKEKWYVLLLYKIHASSFPKEDLDEKMNRWVKSVFKTFNEEARLSIQ
ncbi:hypothetical protein Tco_0902992 [Tanacetum coccineum]